VTDRSLATALDWIADHLEFWARRGEGVKSLRDRMETSAFALRTLAVSTPDQVMSDLGADDLPGPDPETAQHTAQICAHQDLLAAVWLFIDWRHVTERLTAEERTLFADAVEASSARIAQADPTYGEPVVTDRWWQP
jgi:hypothetical protein